MNDVNILLFRMHSSTSARFGRFLSYIEEFERKNFTLDDDQRWEIHVSVDTTVYSPSHLLLSRLRPLLQRRAIHHLHAFNDSVLFSKYPSLTRLHPHLPPWFFSQPSWSRLFHLEAIVHNRVVGRIFVSPATPAATC